TRLIEDRQVPAAAQEGTGQRQALPLASGQQDAGLRVFLVRQVEEGPREQGLVALRQCRKGVVHAGLRGGGRQGRGITRQAEVADGDVLGRAQLIGHVV